MTKYNMEIQNRAEIIENRSYNFRRLLRIILIVLAVLAVLAVLGLLVFYGLVIFFDLGTTYVDQPYYPAR
jgi:cell division septal protein FtsQ